MKKIRLMFRFNQDLPGAIETVHPHKFLEHRAQYLSFYLRRYNIVQSLTLLRFQKRLNKFVPLRVETLLAFILHQLHLYKG